MKFGRLCDCNNSFATLGMVKVEGEEASAAGAFLQSAGSSKQYSMGGMGGWGWAPHRRQLHERLHVVIVAERRPNALHNVLRCQPDA